MSGNAHCIACGHFIPVSSLFFCKDCYESSGWLYLLTKILVTRV